MNKILRITMVVALTIVSSCTFAQTTVTFTAGTDKGSKTGNGNPDQVTKDGVTIASTDGAFAAVNGSTNADEYRIYKNATFTVTSTVGNITKMEMTCATSGSGSNLRYGADGFATADGLVVSEDKKSCTWTGDAASFSLTASVAQVRASQIVITIGAANPNTIAAPTISGETPFTTSTTVTISASDGATVYYTTNGQDPDAQSGTQYDAPFQLTETATVKAIAVKDDKQSSVASKTFTKEEIINVDNIAEFKQLATGTKANLKLANAQVLYTWTSSKGNTSTYVRDNTGAILFYKSTLGLNANEILNGSITGSLDIFNSIPEFMEVAGTTNLGNVTRTAGAAAEPKSIQVSEGLDNLCDLVKLTNVEIGTTTYTNSQGKTTINYYAVDGTDSVQIYNGFHLDAYNDLGSVFTGDTKYTITGIVGAVFNNKAEIYLTDNGVTTGIKNVIKEDGDAPAFNAAGQRVSPSYKGLIIRNGKKFVRK